MVKNVKNRKKYAIFSHKLNTLKSLEHLNVLLRFFFVSDVFQNFGIDFWPLQILFSIIHMNL